MTDTELWFTRATLRRDAPDLAPLVGRLLPEDGEEGEKLNAAHQLLWTLMPQAMQQAGKPGRADGGEKAAFLWREAEQLNSWYLLGPMPRDDSPFFTVEPKPYGLALQAGNRLSFDLVANATVNRLVDPEKGRDGRKRCDVVMDALKAQERATGTTGDRAARRQSVAAEALAGWLAEQGGRNGFALNGFDLVSYRTVEIDRPRVGRGRASPAKKGPLMGVGRMRGLITVTDPAAFAAKVATGFGRAKAFGCGLMLLRQVE
ncbi:type I-E CRISPR-associated protein Cas6/Cse3/CasE [Agrobacterium sp. a22-2]|uniref:type I-E CRISPR-associated protein Cas6/Cse3/CasE n=1 Tax=Agrobacterium sp. a22-2 TaxID=2283840 RepID=UPI001444D683|nr:type I-E CRISPR-associated protein Cas6/Cse3/CasE [Agrobacterium sp. a22-2]NKN38470.1 type I-E CRISPR-associated protein Cas6/Cse3/CasE [Agrobacterium sp. a22-2]